MYKTEHDFSRSLSTRLAKEYMRVTRIESHGTGNGIPDMFVDGKGFDVWLELKNDSRVAFDSKVVKVAWRPGQLAWMLDYYTKHRNKCCLTLVACVGGIIIIPVITLFQEHKVYNPQGIQYADLPQIKLARVLEAMSTIITGENWLDCINKMCAQFYPGIDYDPEVLMNPDLLYETDMTAFNMSKLNAIMTLEMTAVNNNQQA